MDGAVSWIAPMIDRCRRNRGDAFARCLPSTFATNQAKEPTSSPPSATTLKAIGQNASGPIWAASVMIAIKLAAATPRLIRHRTMVATSCAMNVRPSPKNSRRIAVSNAVAGFTMVSFRSSCLRKGFLIDTGLQWLRAPPPLRGPPPHRQAATGRRRGSTSVSPSPARYPPYAWRSPIRCRTRSGRGPACRRRPGSGGGRRCWKQRCG